MSLVAGAATRDLIPPDSAPLFGYPGVRRMSAGVHDPVLASALFLGDPTVQGAGAVILALDLLFLDPPVACQLRAAVARATELSEACVFVGYTHAHSSPVCARLLAWHGDAGAPEPDPAYLEHVIEQAVAAAAAARLAAVPAALAWTSVEVHGVGGNRLRADGPTDPECAILSVRRATGGEPFASIVVYGMHPTVLHEDSLLISSDFPHYTRCFVKERFGADHVCVYLMGPSGDQSPRRFVNGQTFAEAERLGRNLGSFVVHAMEKLAPGNFQPDAGLAGRLQSVPLPRRTLPAREMAAGDLEQAERQFAELQAATAPRAEVRTAECAVFGARSALNLANAQADGVLDRFMAEAGVPEIQALRVGGVTLLGIPGELFVGYSLELKSRAPAPVVPVSLVNGQLQGYICTPEAAAAGGYEAANSLYAPEAGRILVGAALELISSPNTNATAP